MGSKTTTSTKNTYEYMTPPETPEMAALKKAVSTTYDTIDPSIAYSFNNARQTAQDRLDNPFGADYSPEVSDALRYAVDQDMNQQQGQAMREDAFNRGQAKIGALGAIAAGTAPQLVTSGTSGTQKTSSAGGIFGTLASAGATVGSAALM